MKKLFLAALMAIFIVPSQAAAAVRLTMLVDLNYVVTRHDPDLIVDIDESWTRSITLTGNWEDGFNTFNVFGSYQMCANCMKPSFTGNTLYISSAADSLPCVCFETVSLTFDRNINAGPSALAGAEFVSGTLRYWSGYRSPPYTSENLTGQIRSVSITQPIPEPATWAMMIGGFAMVGAAMRRRKVAVSFA